MRLQYSERRHSPPLPGAAALELQDLAVAHAGEQAPAVQGASLVVAPGELFALVGPNGAGKSSILKAIAGLLPALSGSIRIFGLPVGACHHRVAYLPLPGAAGRLRDALEALDRNDVVALDGIEAIAGDRDDEVALFDFHNRMHDAGRALFYAARGWPDALPLALPDLRSRLSQCRRCWR